jgi:hypothetical protein
LDTLYAWVVPWQKTIFPEIPPGEAGSGLTVMNNDFTGPFPQELAVETVIFPELGPMSAVIEFVPCPEVILEPAGITQVNDTPA